MVLNVILMGCGPRCVLWGHFFHLAAPLKQSHKCCRGDLTPQFSDTHFGTVSQSTKMSNYAL